MAYTSSICFYHSWVGGLVCLPLLGYRLTTLGFTVQTGLRSALWFHFFFYQHLPGTWALGGWSMGAQAKKTQSSFKTSSFFKTINILRPHTSHLAKPNIKWTEKHTLSILMYCKERGWRIKNHPVYQSVCGSTHQQSLGSCFWVPWREGVSALWHRDSSSTIE